MKNNLPTFRRLVNQYQHYSRKLMRLSTGDRRRQQKRAWIEKRMQKLRSRIEHYLTRGAMFKRAALVSAGLGAIPLISSAQQFALRSDHPFINLVVPNEQAAPTFVDYDGDGDKDLFLFSDAATAADARDEAVQYFENTGSGFIEGSVAQFPSDLGYTELLDTTVAFEEFTGNFVDFDGDGDLDVFIGTDLDLRYLRNTDGVYEAVIGDGDPFDTLNFDYNVVPAFGDIDGDGDVDAILGSSTGLQYFLNDEGVLTDMGKLSIDGNDSYASPLLYDIDDDGDLDLLTGNKYGDMYYFENNDGTLTQKDHFLTSIVLDGYDRLAFADVDFDGDEDFVFGTSNGNLGVYSRDGGDYEEMPYNTLDIILPFSGLAPEFVDFDGDGDEDLFFGVSAGSLVYYENREGDFMLNGERFPELFDSISSSIPAFADLDTDGDMDLLVGSYGDPLILYTNEDGSYMQVDSTANPFFGLSDQVNQAPALADTDGDGDMDLLLGNKLGTLEYFVNNDGVYELMEESPFSGIEADGYSTPELKDSDGDGDLDLFLGGGDGLVMAFENENGEFVQLVGDDNPFGDLQFHDDAIFACSDIDGDGDLDAIVGNDLEMALFLENTSISVATDDRQDVSQETNVFPNPVMHTVQIEAPWNNHQGKLEVFSMQGRLMYDRLFFGAAARFNLSTLPTGNYQLLISNQERKAVKGIYKH